MPAFEAPVCLRAPATQRRKQCAEKDDFAFCVHFSLAPFFLSECLSHLTNTTHCQLTFRSSSDDVVCGNLKTIHSYNMAVPSNDGISCVHSVCGAVTQTVQVRFTHTCLLHAFPDIDSHESNIFTCYPSGSLRHSKLRGAGIVDFGEDEPAVSRLDDKSSSG